MAEYKPKKDEQLIADAKANMPHPSKESKAHGDKLQDAVDEAAKKPRQKQ
ncbi:MAG TPA: hypothetical protein VNR11_03070 [Xanthobacteraceae bacterium]|nr:hypothetical protein [Xanthobacteraceae bacterium]